jgi:Winged helix-turn helix
VLRFKAEGSDGVITRKAPGKASILDDHHRKALAAIVEAGPIPASHGVVRWRIVDLAAGLHDEFGLSVTRYTLGRELRGRSYRTLSARPRHHGQEAHAIPEFKKLRAPVDRDQARLSARNAKPGSRAAGQSGQSGQPGHQRPKISEPGQPICWAAPAFGPGAIYHAEGKGAGLVLPWVATARG